ncbi:PTS sugar transporter subunit IIA [Seinonella peptonophila]|nr:PTS sugar transporter subunit IIA [Seinonella peptonophila]
MKIIVATHGELSQGLIHAAKMLIGVLQDVASIQLQAGENIDHFQERFAQLIGETDEHQQCLIFCDILGGTPFNIASKLSYQNQHIVVFHGVNLPIFLEAIMQREGKNVNALAEELATNAANSLGIGMF